MNTRTALLASICAALALAGCDGGESLPPDSGVDPLDSGMNMRDGGDDPDTGVVTDSGTDSGTDTDSGADTDSGTDTDSGAGDSGLTDAGCVPDTCMPGECGVNVRDDGCGTPLDCGPCAIGGPCNDDTGCSTGECLTEYDSAWDSGYCTRECRVDADCAAVGTHCAYVDDLTRIGLCVADCVNDADCRGPEYTCQDDDEAGTDECAPFANGAGMTGEPCDAHSDCGGGMEGFCIRESSGWREGYCSRTCVVDSDCGSGRHCGFIPAGGGDGACVDNCASDADCRMDGYTCHNADEDAGGVDECAPAATGMGDIGDPCVGAWDCAGGVDGRCLTEATGSLGGFCYEVECVTDTDCPANSHCGNFGDAMDPVNICTPDCTTDADCRASGYACWDANEDGRDECWAAGTGTAAVGDPCAGVYDCAGGERAVCVRRPRNDFNEGYCLLTGCTAGGTGPASCPAGSHCSIAPMATEGICVDSCGTDADCRTDGYRCYDTGDADAVSECWPAATGTGAVGAPCRWLTDCAGDENGGCWLLSPGTGLPDFVGGYCVQGCGAGGTCPAGSACQGGSVCMDSCTASVMCRIPDSYTCQAPFGGGQVCFPM